MERIDIQPGAYFPASQYSSRDKAEKKKKTSGKNSFLRLFSSESAEVEANQSLSDSAPLQQAEAEVLFQSIQAAGENLRRFPGKENIEEYQKLVRSLVGRVVRDGIVVEEHSSGAHVLKRKSFSLIKVIDAKLVELANGVLVTQRDQFQLMAKLQEIQGLLVDMLH